MNIWLLRRISANVLVLFMALVINFMLPRLMPGDPLNVFTGGVKLTVEARQAIIERFGLDAPYGNNLYTTLQMHYAVIWEPLFIIFPSPYGL